MNLSEEGRKLLDLTKEDEEKIAEFGEWLEEKEISHMFIVGKQDTEGNYLSGIIGVNHGVPNETARAFNILLQHNPEYIRKVALLMLQLKGTFDS